MSGLQKIQQTIQFLFFPCLTTLLLTGANINAAEQTSCYRFLIDSNVTDSVDHHQSRFEKWCYRRNMDNNDIYIYNVDNAKVNPELAMLVDKNGILTHGSLAGGRVTVHRVNAKDFNPYSIPLSEPSDEQRIALTANEFSDFAESANEVLDIFKMSDSAPASLDIYQLQPSATANRLPWRGYWWPRKNMPMLTPLRKYDSYVAARGGGNPGAAAYEQAHHGYHGVSWSGHCNGWAAAAIIRSEPRSTRHDPISGVTFSVGDQKGMLSELDYCVSTAFFGKRNNGGGNNGDIRPELFHKTVLYYIGNLKKPVVMDYRQDPSVDNHVVSGYSMNIQQNGANRFIVTATMSFHRYDKSNTSSVGIAPRYTRIYKYNLTTNSSGQPIGGSWISSNPDFVWVPLSPARCKSNNQRITSAWIQQIIGI
ncbi:MAG: hypothetical protein A2622_07165 [Bdellovibrionales bacterium RIFCSPHIGHO2_01_FULL_40_29]|nr:MAG: hypothetical protein A2622_07165 [Bdellovibrionales bacterium RIFCSPHIGHO2_01_FULL_40_29]OFZ33254.1 MAG: hypothetical protein A3D17_12185 [Bdellovibrionales bacterium RIFCSPHIGHO2_02_FULL_40_15]